MLDCQVVICGLLPFWDGFDGWRVCCRGGGRRVRGAKPAVSGGARPFCGILSLVRMLTVEFILFL